MLPQRSIGRSDEIEGDILRLIQALTGTERHNDPDKGGVGPVVTNGVGNHVELGFVLAGDHPVPGLIPVENKTFTVPFLDDIPVDIKGIRPGTSTRTVSDSEGTQPLPGRQFLGECGVWPVR